MWAALAVGLLACVSAQDTTPHAMAGCAYDKGWIGSTCPRVHSRPLVRDNGCCIGGGREGQCPLNCPGTVTTDSVTGDVTCECQTPCDPPQPEECSRDPDFDECGSSPCQNGGECTDEGEMYTCACSGGWLGENCDIPPPVRVWVLRYGLLLLLDKHLSRVPCRCCWTV